MIRITANRTRGQERPQPADVREVSPAEAFRSLVRYELGYGASVTHLGPTSLSVRTLVMTCVDDTRFEGTVEEMSLLCEVAALIVMIRSSFSETSKVAEAMLLATRGNPLRIKMSIGIVGSTNTVKAALSAMLPFFEEIPALRLRSFPLEDFVELVVLHRFGNATMQECIELLDLEQPA